MRRAASRVLFLAVVLATLTGSTSAVSAARQTQPAEEPTSLEGQVSALVEGLESAATDPLGGDQATESPRSPSIPVPSPFVVNDLLRDCRNDNNRRVRPCDIAGMGIFNSPAFLALSTSFVTWPNNWDSGLGWRSTANFWAIDNRHTPGNDLLLMSWRNNGRWAAALITDSFDIVCSYWPPEGQGSLPAPQRAGNTLIQVVPRDCLGQNVNVRARGFFLWDPDASPGTHGLAIDAVPNRSNNTWVYTPVVLAL